MALRPLRKPNLASSAVLPDELMAEIFSRLSVKHLMQLRCVNKFFKTLISDPYFVQMHLKKSARKPNLSLMWLDDCNDQNFNFVSLSNPRFLQNQFNLLDNYPSYQSNNFFGMHLLVGSCNGLICLIGGSSPSIDEWLCFWNPATRTISENFRLFSDLYSCISPFKFSFGYDNSNETYKVVAYFVMTDHGHHLKGLVKVFSLRDNSWRDIQCLPVIPLYWGNANLNDDVVYLNGTINWLAYSNPDMNTNLMGFIEDYVILSLDLSTESYTQMLLPRGFDKGPHIQAIVAVLMDFLCFGRDIERNYFVIWQMKDFGVQESWIQLFKISYQNFYPPNVDLFDAGWLELLPLYLFENGYTLILAKNIMEPAFIYDCRDYSVQPIRIKLSWAKHYIESLVTTR